MVLVCLCNLMNWDDLYESKFLRTPKINIKFLILSLRLLQYSSNSSVSYTRRYGSRVVDNEYLLAATLTHKMYTEKTFFLIEISVAHLVIKKFV